MWNYHPRYKYHPQMFIRHPHPTAEREVISWIHAICPNLWYLVEPTFLTVPGYREAPIWWVVHETAILPAIKYDIEDSYRGRNVRRLGPVAVLELN